MIKQILLVGAGGAVGSILRFLTSELTWRFWSQSFPLGTFIVNIIGCFLIGLLINVAPAHSVTRLVFVVGFCGGFTTFSSFARENLELINQNQSLLALGYIVASCLLGIFAVWLGMLIGK